LHSVAVCELRFAAAATLVGLGFLIDQSIGHRDAQTDHKTFSDLCAHLNLTEPQVGSLLKEIGESYQRDRGRGLLKEAFPDWP
jgi:hypothetical protein